MEAFRFLNPHLLIHVLVFLAWALGVLMALYLLYLLRQMVQPLIQMRRNMVFLELTPPAHDDRVPVATSELFLALHGLNRSRTLLDKLLGRQVLVSLEIPSTRSEGVRYMVSCTKHHAPEIEQMILSYDPNVRVRKVKDYLSSSKSGVKARVLEFRQKKHYAFPLEDQPDLVSHDPIAYITNAMTKLGVKELMSFQVLVSPVELRSAKTLLGRIQNNEDVLLRLKGKSLRPSLTTVFTIINTILFGILGMVTEGFHGSSKTSTSYRSVERELEYKKQVAKGIKPARTLSYFEHEVVESLNQKLSQPLFRVSIRVLIQVDTTVDFKARKIGIVSALNIYGEPRKQQLVLRKLKHHFMSRYSSFSFRYRLPVLLAQHSSVFSASEIASLYHFPHSMSAKTENVVKSLSKTLPAPVSLKNGSKLDILLGVNSHQGTKTAIGLTSEERQRHVYIIGGTGNGKTTMLKYSIVQDIENGKGIAVLDPHGDLAESLLHCIPEERIQDVIYLNPDDLTYPIGINLLELTPGLTGDDLLREKDLITESTISVLRKIFSDDDSGGHRIEYVLRNAIQTALTTENPTLFTIFKLLNNAKYRRSITNQLEDEDLKSFWNSELGKAGEFQKVKMVSGITAKIGRFLFSASAKRILEQEKSTIDFEDIINSGKILICNFSKGLLGEDTSTLFGTTVLSKLQVAALRRARTKQTERNPFYLYVDEFQNFATMSFVQMLSEARKYKLFLTMAEQSTSQQDQQRLVDIILANVGTVICFRSGSPADERYVLPLFNPYIQQGEIANLPAYNFYARIAAVEAQEPLSGITVLLPESNNDDVARQVITSSRKIYAFVAAKEKPSQVQMEVVETKSRKRQKKPSAALVKQKDFQAHNPMH